MKCQECEESTRLKTREQAELLRDLWQEEYNENHPRSTHKFFVIEVFE